MLNPLSVAGGRVAFDVTQFQARLAVGPVPERRYTNAQLDDYGDAGSSRAWGRGHFHSGPPLRLSLRARASHALPVGTLGFGFWNNPFTLSGGVLSTPNALWFFYASPPSDMALAEGVRGWGWKAASLNTGHLPGLVVAPAALAAIALTRVPGLGRPIMAIGRRLAHAHEALLDDVALDSWHAYQLDWRPGEAIFAVDGTPRLRSPAPPRGPLGFVLWIDNQYAVVSRDGRFAFGVRPLAEEQWLEVDEFRLDRGMV